MTVTPFAAPLPDAELFDISEWPLVYARFPELDMPDRLNRVLNGLDAILAQQQPYVIAWVPATHDHDDEPHEDEKKSTIWMKRRKVDIRKYCAGYIYITRDPALRALLLGRFPQVQKFLPYPKLLADDRDDARAKARDLLG